MPTLVFQPALWWPQMAAGTMLVVLSIVYVWRTCDQPHVAPAPLLTDVKVGQKKQERWEKWQRKQRKAEVLAHLYNVSEHPQRHIALRVAYIGERYSGLAMQVGSSVPTVEGELFNALQKTCLISNPNDCAFSRCGRTDRGVSAIGQVVALRVRSAIQSAKEEPGLILAKPKSQQGELDYVRMLNGVLPPDIRVLAWAPVAANFSARFSCVGRIYKYFFLRRDLDIAAMHTAAQCLVGTHDFRNFCKMDVVNTSHFTRCIHSFVIEPWRPSFVPSPGERDILWVATIHGTGFLRRQVRCMMQVLFNVGVGDEDPTVVLHLLDIAATPSKPQYGLASGESLVLWDCQFPDLQWFGTTHSEWRLLNALIGMYEAACIRTAMLDGLRHIVEDTLPFTGLQLSDRTEAKQVFLKDVADANLFKAWQMYPSRPYTPIQKLKREPGYEERVRSLSPAKKMRRNTNIKKGRLKEAVALPSE
eukprot:GGOE01044484.1.p1 GENE.GGOE01044484.1~~GGOE01044484.1.p1  ORF type:complete len:474 (-),score=111.94 GGOE01044484.1:214-1635(-)